MIFRKPINPVAINAALFCGFRIYKRQIAATVCIDSGKELAWCGWVLNTFFGSYIATNFGPMYVCLQSRWSIPDPVDIDGELQDAACRGFASARALLRPQKTDEFIMAISPPHGPINWPWPHPTLSARYRHHGRDIIMRWEPKARLAAVESVMEATRHGYGHPKLKREDYLNAR